MARKETFSLKILNEKGVLFFGECRILFLPSPSGEVAIMAQHTPMIMKLAPGKVRMRAASGGINDVVTLTSGIVYVAEDDVAVLVDL